MSDEVREFHLDGKQLAFLVISAIGVSVVVFLCGVMVGRGVRGLSAGERVEGGLNAPPSDTGVTDADVPVATDGRNPKEKKSPIPNESVSYQDRLIAATPEALHEPLPATKATPAPPAATRAPAPATPVTKEPARGRFYVQVSSGTQHSAAEDLKRKLEARQYKASVSEVVVQGRTWFRVRVGPFDTKPEATAVKDRLKPSFKDSMVVPPR